MTFIPNIGPPAGLADHYGPAESIVVSGFNASIATESDYLMHPRGTFLANFQIPVNYLSPPSGVSFKDAFLRARLC
jgi:hypothetical protein